MKILSGGKKDYYDYLVGIYGIDEDITYDRRDSYVLSHITYGMQLQELSPVKQYFDRPRMPKKMYRNVNGKAKLITKEVGFEYDFVLEVGTTHYWFKVERYLDNDNLRIEASIYKVFDDVEKISSAPLAIIPIHHRGYSTFYNQDFFEYKKQQRVDNPILNNTFIPSFISANEIYNKIYSYLISIREKKIVDNRTDIQKLESKGFDKTSSFRHPVNKQRKNK